MLYLSHSTVAASTLPHYRGYALSRARCTRCDEYINYVLETYSVKANKFMIMPLDDSLFFCKNEGEKCEYDGSVVPLTVNHKMTRTLPIP